MNRKLLRMKKNLLPVFFIIIISRGYPMETYAQISGDGNTQAKDLKKESRHNKIQQEGIYKKDFSKKDFQGKDFQKDEFIDKFRRSLTNPDLYQIRKRDSIDADSLLNAIRTFAQKNSPLIREKFRQSLAALKEKEISNMAAYDLLGHWEIKDHQIEAKHFEVAAFIYPDIRRVTFMSIYTLVPRLLVEKRSLSSVEVGKWIIYLNYALPEISRCGMRDGQKVICVDYHRDLFIVLIKEKDPVCLPTLIEWWQKRPGSKSE